MITATRQRPFYSWHRQISIQIRKSDCSIILHITFSSLVTLFFSVLQHTLHFSASHAFLSLPVSSPGATPSSLVPPDPSCPHPQNHSLHFPTTSSSQNVSVGHDLGAYQKPAPLNTHVNGNWHLFPAPVFTPGTWWRREPGTRLLLWWDWKPLPLFFSWPHQTLILLFCLLLVN